MEVHDVAGHVVGKLVAENPFQWGWDSLVAIGTLLLAFATAWLAYRTSQMAKDAEQSMIQLERHHRQQLSGILSTDVCIIFQEAARNESGLIQYHIKLKAGLRNLGGGAAMNCSFEIQLPHNTPPHNSLSLRLPSLGAGAMDDTPVTLWHSDSADANMVDWDWKDATFTLTCFSIFGTSVSLHYDFLRLDHSGTLRSNPRAIFVPRHFGIE